MPRIFVFECPTCDYKTSKKIEYTPPENTTQINPSRFVVNLDEESEHDGYPSQTIICPECKQSITSKPLEKGKVPPVYFNYMGDD